MISEKDGFIHHVYFWLKNPESSDDCNQLVEGLEKLSKVSTIKDFHIGKPASTRRPVIDSSYSVSWLVPFKNKQDHDSYQTDPIHLKFVEECKHLWDKIQIYDTVDLNNE
jgi:hypothetical protein